MVIEDNDKVPKITREVIRAVPGSKFGRLYGNELSFILPQDDQSVEYFANLFKAVSTLFFYLFCIVMMTILFRLMRI